MGNMMDKISGKAKETIGKATDNRKLELKGKIQQGKASLKDKAEHIGEEIKDKLAGDR